MRPEGRAASDAVSGAEGTASVQPIVLVGGQSRRFGRDKLVEPVAGQLLVAHPVAALREVFGPRVKLVGECDQRLAAVADGTIADLHPGVGPMGGIASALAAWGGAVFVLAGDMPRISATEIRRILIAAKNAPTAAAVLAFTDRLHPCAGLYRPVAGPILNSLIAQGQLRLAAALPASLVHTVELDPAALANINRPSDLEPAAPRS